MKNACVSEDQLPKLSDSEVMTMEIVGMYLGESQDKSLFEYFCRHWIHFFPALRHLHRTRFMRQSANLWVIKERLWCAIRDEVLSYDPSTAIIDSFPLPVVTLREPIVVRVSKAMLDLAKIIRRVKPCTAFGCMRRCAGLRSSLTWNCQQPMCSRL